MVRLCLLCQKLDHSDPEITIHSLTSLEYTSSSFLYGEPCSQRNTAYLYISNWSIPGASTKCVDIAQSTFPNTETEPFISQVRQADTLYADHLNLSLFPVSIIHELPNLDLIDLSGNKIRKVPYKLYKIMPRVSKMLLSENAIFVPRKRALFKSVSVRMLMLTGNGISHINTLTFSKMPNLEILYLDENKIKYVQPVMFSPLSKLLYLHLGSNVITDFPSKEKMPLSLKYYITRDQKKIK